jgi:hypothetical protein
MKTTHSPKKLLIVNPTCINFWIANPEERDDFFSSFISFLLINRIKDPAIHNSLKS